MHLFIKTNFNFGKKNCIFFKKKAKNSVEIFARCQQPRRIAQYCRREHAKSKSATVIATQAYAGCLCGRHTVCPGNPSGLNFILQVVSKVPGT